MGFYGGFSPLESTDLYAKRPYILITYVSFQKSGKKGRSSENISKRPASIRIEHTHNPVSGIASQESSGPTACPSVGPMLLNEEILSPTASSIGIPKAAKIPVPKTSRPAHIAKYTKIVRHISLVIIVWFMRTGNTAFG